MFDDPNYKDFNVPMLEGTAAEGCQIVERPVDQRTLTRRYTDRAIDEIKRMKDEPFFLYLAHSLPHVPLFRSDEFRGHSAAGVYGDVIEEIDHGVGRIMATLREESLDENTMVVFTSDNGPWLVFEDQGGSAGPLKDGKGTTFEGGMRVPTIFHMPGTVVPRNDSGLSSTLDLLPTFAAMAGVDPPDVALDGSDLSTWLSDQAPSPRQTMFYWRDLRLMAIRHGDHKVHYITQSAYGGKTPATEHNPPLVYDLSIDLRERNDIADERADVIAEVAKIRDQFESDLDPVASQLDR